MIVLPQASGNGSSVTGATASVDANVGTPSVDVTMKEGKLNFAFKNLKGQKGDTGVVGAKVIKVNRDKLGPKEIKENKVLLERKETKAIPVQKSNQ